MKGKQRTNKRAEGDTEEVSIKQSRYFLSAKETFLGLTLRRMILHLELPPTIEPSGQLCSMYLVKIMQKCVRDDPYLVFVPSCPPE